MKKTLLQKLAEAIPAALYRDGDEAGAEDAGKVRDWTLAGAIISEKLYKRTEHNARTLCIIGEGLKKISEDLNNQVADIDQDIIESIHKEDDKMWGKGPGLSPEEWSDRIGAMESEMVYIIDTDDEGTRYYGPTDYNRACEMVNMIGGNVDVTATVPDQAEPIEKLHKKQKARRLQEQARMAQEGK